MSKERTITVNGHFGKVEVTKKEYVDTWTSHVKELRKLDYNTGWYETVQDIIHRVEEKAKFEFDCTWMEQEASK